jgi:hypothetical protein
MANTAESAEVPTSTIRSVEALSVDESPDAIDDLTELEFTPLPPEEASELEDRVYLLGARHGVRPF